MDFWEFRNKEFVRRDTRLQNRQPMELIKTEDYKERLHIVYVMTWVGICGGSKIILQHCNQLIEKGHKATIVCHFPKPIWFPLDARVAFVHAPMGEVLCEYIPKCDVIVATYWKEIYECVEQKMAPVVYFEQGDTHLFDQATMNAHTMEHIRKQIGIAPFVYTVSTFAAEKLKENFNANAKVIPNAIDKTIFYPTQDAKEIKGGDKTTITTIGSEHIGFKCIINIVMAIEILKKMGHDIEFIWISPDAPSKLTMIPVMVNPAQKEIGECMRKSDIYVCASLYESFCLPVLEAMTSGAAVVTTDNGGIRDFVTDGSNGLIIEKNNIADMVEKITMLINDTQLRRQIAVAAMETAQAFDWQYTTDKLISYYRDIASYRIKGRLS